MHDRARIHVVAGAGGDGCVSLRREAHVPRGGPDGGDGGRGGDVVLICDGSLRDLSAYHRRQRFRAGRGGHGQGALRHGAHGRTLALPVPPGTQVLVERDGARYDLVHPGQRATVARGGAGGRGNRRFAGPTRQTPRFAERGLAGEETWISLSLKLLADVGLVGLPNAGKSSLLARLTRARPRVAPYPFTTLDPVLGTLEADGRQLVLADIPGLIEGASDGAGLGHEFLAHVERTRLLVHVLELAPLDGSDPVDNHATVERELRRHDRRLAELPRVLALSKADLVDAAAAAAARERWRARLGDRVPVVITSALTGVGLPELTGELLASVPVAMPGHAGDSAAAGGALVAGALSGGGPGCGGPVAGAAAPGGAEPGAVAKAAGAAPAPGASAHAEELAEHRVWRPAAGRAFEVTRRGEGEFAVTGAAVERLVARYDLDNEEALAHLERRLRGLGVVRALQAAGFRAGDEVSIAGVAFDFDPDS
ncbi:MAG TPA: Obg family GTPase CgtA [Solirubrobacteraceae bacterium]|nr:Obg family GTPase CgtA [Solirubrobacteraceae bacterium]